LHPPTPKPTPPHQKKKKLTIHDTLDHFKQGISMSDLHIWLSSSDKLKLARKSLPTQKKNVVHFKENAICDPKGDTSLGPCLIKWILLIEISLSPPFGAKTYSEKRKMQ
jgi:hypothetical protein